MRDERDLPDTVAARFLDAAELFRISAALEWKDGGTWHTFTFADFKDAVANVAGQLLAGGVDPGDRVALMLENRPEFFVADLAVLFCGATPISIYNTSSIEQINYIVEHSDAKFVITESGYISNFLPRLSVGKNDPRLRVFSVDKVNESQAYFLDIRNSSQAVDLETQQDLSSASSLATIIYTSGTTGAPKAARITNSNVCAVIDGFVERTNASTSGMKVFSYLPMAHIAERMSAYYTPITQGETIVSCASLGYFRTLLKESRPNIFFGVPRVWENLYAGITETMQSRSIFARTTHRVLLGAKSKNSLRKLFSKAIGRIVGPRILRSVGLDRAVFAGVGAAPIDLTIVAWFRNLGLPLGEIYGLTESTGPATWSPNEYREGSVGKPLTRVKIRLADDGELLIGGDVVFDSYEKDPVRTTEMLDNGWLKTGDIARVDSEGFVFIIDRKRELIVTAGGKNISPANLESSLMSCPLIAHACVIGDRRPYLVALIVLTPKALLDSKARDLVRDHVQKVNSRVSQPEQIKKFEILDHEWQPDSDMLTATSKVKRRNVAARYELMIEQLYQNSA